MKLKRTSTMQPPASEIRGVRPKEFLPDFLNHKDAAGMQEHLIRNDPHRPGEISHFVAVPMDQLSQYVHRRDIDESSYIWELRSMSCWRLRRICTRLDIQGTSNAATSVCLQAIVQQPGNPTFRWEQYKEAAFATRRPTVQPEVVLSSPETTVVPVTPTATLPRKKARRSLEEEDRRSSVSVPIVSVPTPTSARRAVSDEPPNSEPAGPVGRTGEAVTVADTARTTNPSSVSTLGPMHWDTYARIIEQHRRSIEQKRNQEFAYYGELSSLAVNEGVRRYMLRSLESIQESIHVEERALERLQAQHHDCIVRATARDPRTGASSVVPPARAAQYKTTDLYDDE